MLRHIISVGLAMVACTSFMPTKAKAATFTVTPVGGLQRNPGDEITFIFELDPAPSSSPNILRLVSFDYNWDGSELSRVREEFRAPMGTAINNTTTIGRVVFNVRQGVVKDGASDIFNAVAYSLDGLADRTTRSVSVVDVQPVPEPLTMLGAAAALGYGAILKRKYSKRTES